VTRTIALSAVTLLAVSAIGIGTAAATSASNRPKRPAAEHVPTSVHRAHLVRRDDVFSNNRESRTVTGKQARRLVRAFDAMKTQPTTYVHCDLAGGPVEIVTFHAARHTWVVKEMACSNIVVTRDGTSLPTLLPNAAWDRAVHHDLGH
jgi:hypothetical protein